MKKQIFNLLTVLFTLSFTPAYSQLTLTPRVVDATCLSNDAIHPMPGTPYNYSITVPTPAGAKEYTWLVTQDQNFITAPGTLTPSRETTSGNLLAATGTGYNDPATATETLSLTWKSFVYDVARPVFVVVQVRSAVTGACAPNNLKVFMIQPVNAFTLDIANVGADKTTVANYGIPMERCVTDIVSAKFDATSPLGVLYDYGVDYLYYIVSAANFSTSWRPSVKISGVDSRETVTAVEWFRPTDTGFATPEPLILTDGNYVATNPVQALNSSGTVGAAGESILIRVTIDHTNGANQYEGITDETITLAVDGQTQLGSTPIGDIHHSSTIPNANSDCGKADGFLYDIAIQTIKARPEIQSTTAAVPGPGVIPFLPVK